MSLGLQNKSSQQAREDSAHSAFVAEREEIKLVRNAEGGKPLINFKGTPRIRRL